MAQSRATTSSPRRRRPLLSRSLVSMAIFVFIGLYLLSGLPGEVGRWKMAFARSQYNHDEVEQALETAEDARTWDPDNLNMATTRIGWLQQQGDKKAALRELTELLKVVEGNRFQEIELLLNRAELLQWMGKHQEAIADADRMLEYEKAYRRPVNDQQADLRAINARAYVVARARAARAASDKQVGETLEQMRDVLVIWHRSQDTLVAGSGMIEQEMEYRVRELMFLDTYAYLRLGAGDEKAALSDLNRCVEMCDYLTALAVDLAGEPGLANMMRKQVLALQIHKAVIIHHRAEAYALLDNKVAAREDRRTAVALGYDKDNGVW